MKKIILILLSMMVSISHAKEFPVEGRFWVDGKPQKSIEHLMPGQMVKVVVSTGRSGVKETRGRIAEGKFLTQGPKSFTTEYVITKSDARLGYVTLEVYFKSTAGEILGSYVKVIPVMTKKKIEALAKETDEEQLKRVMKELGIDKDKCDTLFKD